MVAPLARLLLGDLVAELGAQPERHLHEVLALVAVLRRLATFVPGEQRRAERVELVPGVVQVVLAVHLGALGGEQVGESRRPPRPIAHRRRAAGRSGSPRRTRGSSAGRRTRRRGRRRRPAR